MKELGVGIPIFLVFIPFLLVVFKGSWIVKYFVVLSFVFTFFFIGMVLNDKGVRDGLFKGKGWLALLLLPLSFAFWYLIWWLTRKRK